MVNPDGVLANAQITPTSIYKTLWFVEYTEEKEEEKKEKAQVFIVTVVVVVFIYRLDNSVKFYFSEINSETRRMKMPTERYRKEAVTTVEEKETSVSDQPETESSSYHQQKHCKISRERMGATHTLINRKEVRTRSWQVFKVTRR
jgi:hypothetical protein